MITSYILVLCLSVWLVAYGLVQLAKRLAVVLGSQAIVPPALCVLLPLLAFLTVVAAPPLVLTAALLLLICHLSIGARQQHRMMRLGSAVMAAALATTSVTIPTIATIPEAAMVGGALVLLSLMVFFADYSARGATAMSTGNMAIVLPLLAAPLMGAPAFIALDVAIIMCALLAALMALCANIDMYATRGSLALIAGWLMLESASHGAWIPPLLALLAYGGAITYGRMLSPPYEHFHAL